MATFISLVNFTDQGIRNVKQTTERLDQFREVASSKGISVQSAYWTMGEYDIVLTLDGPEEAVTAALLEVASRGNVTSKTLRAYSQDEMSGILGQLS